ncbi:MAG: MATE family efflux transporter [Oscillospiraceae bacterium]
MFSRKQLVHLMIPLLIEQLLAVTIGMADTVMVAGVGEAAVSGVSLVDAINNLLLQVFAALGAGGAIVAAQYLGRGDAPSACRASKQLLLVVSLLSLGVSALFLTVNGPLLGLIYPDIDAAVMHNARIYLYMTTLSYPFIALYSAGASIFRAQNNARVSMFASLLMNLLNISGNVLFIYGLDLGAAGAGIATLLSRIVGSMVVLALLRNPINLVHVEHMFCFDFDTAMAGRILRVGIPSGTENGMFHVGKILVSGLVASFGTVAISANAVASSITLVPNIPNTALSLAMITVVGQCVGAGDLLEAKRNILRLMRLTYWMLIPLNGLLWFCAPSLVSFFGMGAQSALLSIKLIRAFAFWHALFCVPSFVLPNALRAAGDVRFTMVVSIASMWFFRIGLSYILGLVLGFGTMGVWFAMYIDWIARSIAFVWRLLSNRWHNRMIL